MSTHTTTNILDVRDGLNELPFRKGTRQVLIGRISDRFEPIETTDEDDGPDDDRASQAAAIEQHLEELRNELAKHDLDLVRGDDDPDELYAVQHLRRESAVDLSWIGEAMGWASRIMAIALLMVLPVVGGMWLDARLGTGFLALLGILIGLPLGLWQLSRLTRGGAKQ